MLCNEVQVLAGRILSDEIHVLAGEINNDVVPILAGEIIGAEVHGWVDGQVLKTHRIVDATLFNVVIVRELILNQANCLEFFCELILARVLQTSIW